MESSFVLVVRMCTLFLIHFVLVSSRKTQDMIYTEINGISACIRRFNATHQIGCSSGFYGNTGVIHYLANDLDVQWMLNVGPHAPYIALMEPQMFIPFNLKQMKDSGKVSGIMVININDSVALEEFFSPDRKCPNDNFGTYSSSSNYSHCSSMEWNPNGNDMNFVDIKLPVIALVSESAVNYVLQCYMDHNEPIEGQPREFPLCAAELHYFMFGAKDTPTCMRRTQQTTNLEPSYFCDPLGDYNLWVSLKPTNKDEKLPEKKLIVLAAQVDATSMFYNVLPRNGAEHAATGYITLLAVAQTLGALDYDIREKMSDIMFVFFQGESYDYIGSSRMVYDMKNGNFPYTEDDSKTQPASVSLDNIGYYLELKQLGLAKNSKLYAHTDPITQADTQTKRLTEELIDSLKSSVTGDVTINEPPANQSLPPASFQRFLRGGAKVPGAVLADHMSQYENNFYNSRFDTATLLKYDGDENSTDSPLAEELRNIATTVSRAVYKLALPNATDANSISTNLTTVNEMLYCFLIKANCRLFRSINTAENAQNLLNTSYPSYVGVFSTNSGPLTSMIHNLVGYFTGNLTQIPADQCKDDKSDQIYHYFYIQGPEKLGWCVETNLHLAPAKSPAFISGQEDWSSTEYSTWTESQWGSNSFSARVYLKPSRKQESVIFCIGVAVMLTSLLGGYFLNARASVLFSPL